MKRTYFICYFCRWSKKKGNKAKAIHNLNEILEIRSDLINAVYREAKQKDISFSSVKTQIFVRFTHEIVLTATHMNLFLLILKQIWVII
jgi:hypothetical protein